jgi:glycosyltransferase involved in cell wall biosynthesis
LLNELVERKEHVDFPAQTFQLSLLKGLLFHLNSLHIVTSPVIRSKRENVKDICKGYMFSHLGGEIKEDIYVGTIIIPGLQMFFEFIKVYRCVKKLLSKSSVDNLFIYALHSPFLLAAVLLRKQVRCSCVIVPDLPDYMSNKGGIIRRIGKKIDKSIINYCVKRLDCFVLLSSYMREKLPIRDKRWTLMEGIYNQEDNVSEDIGKCPNKAILYTGNLSKRMGIIELLDAFRQIKDPDFRLWIRGNGEAKLDVINAQKEDNRIIYYDPMPLAEIRKLQRQATVLINPTRASQEFTKYFFPSKTMEYLASGTPTIMYKLPCLPKSYYEHIYFIENETVDGLRKKIIEVCEKSDEERRQFGKKASEFICHEKNAIVQTRKIINLIENNNNIK